MLRRKNVYRRFIALALILGLAAIAFSPSLQKASLRWVEIPIGSMIYYIQQGTSSTFNGVGGIWRGYMNLVGVREENNRLRAEVERLRGENDFLKEEGALAKRLQAILDYRQSVPLRFVAAGVIGRGTTHLYKTIIVNKGEDDGVAADMGVVTPEGVVGKIIKTGSHHAQVLLMTDRNSAIASVIQQTRDEGIAQGIEGGIRLKYLPNSSEAEAGDLVVTSGLEGSFTKGLTLGTVEAVKKRENDLFLDVRVIPAVDFSKLEEVLIITSTGVPEK